MPQPLNRTTAGIKETLPVKIIQFGGGNFLRAFTDWMIDILNETTDFKGSIRIVKPTSRGTMDVLKKQDGLFHVLLQGIKQGETYSQIRLVKSVTGGVNPYKDYQAFLALGENPDLEFIVSNTTEAGISFDENDTSPEKVPDSFPGKLTALLYRRFRYFKGDLGKAPAVLPCELIDKNGDKLKELVIRYASTWNLEPEFRQWIDKHVTFCNTLVDRIVPGFPEEQASDIQQETGFKDKLIVSGEYFHLWIIEGPDWIQKKLPFMEAGLNVKFVDDLSPYRNSKVRILNGIHTSMVPVGYLFGCRTVKEAIDDKLVGKFLTNALFKEIIPTLDLPEEELKEFAGDVLDRFRNPFIRHELMSIALNSVSKYKVRVLPSVLEYEKIHAGLPARLVFALAALIRFYKGEWNGLTIPLKDSDKVIEFMRKAWEADNYKQTAQKVLSHKEFWDRDLTQIPGMPEMVVRFLKQIDDRGVKKAIRELES